MLFTSPQRHPATYLFRSPVIYNICCHGNSLRNRLQLSGYVGSGIGIMLLNSPGGSTPCTGARGDVERTRSRTVNNQFQTFCVTVMVVV